MMWANLPLLKNPMNWLTVIFMLILAAIAGHLILTGMGFSAATADDNNN